MGQLRQFPRSTCAFLQCRSTMERVLKSSEWRITLQIERLPEQERLPLAVGFLEHPTQQTKLEAVGFLDQVMLNRRLLCSGELRRHLHLVGTRAQQTLEVHCSVTTTPTRLLQVDLFSELNQRARHCSDLQVRINLASTQFLTLNLATTGASTFGQTTGSSLFGNQQPQTNTGGSLFGNTQNQNQSGSLFGNTGTTGTGLFGQAQQQPQQQSSGFSFGGAPAVS